MVPAHIDSEDLWFWYIYLTGFCLNWLFVYVWWALLMRRWIDQATYTLDEYRAWLDMRAWNRNRDGQPR